jgi:hypothetical protein
VAAGPDGSQGTPHHSAAEEILWSSRGLLGPAVIAPRQLAPTSLLELARSHDSVLTGSCTHFRTPDEFRSALGYDCGEIYSPTNLNRETPLMAG